jgi:hypothetical protein
MRTFPCGCADREAETPERRLDPIHHRHRPAQVDVAIEQVRDQPRQRTGGERIAHDVAATDQELDPRAARASERFQLVAEDDVARVADAIEHRQVARRPRQRLEECAQRRDADPTGDEEHLRTRPAGAREHAVWPLDEDAGPDRDALERLRPIAQFLDRDAQPRAVRCRRDRERMRPPPAFEGQESPHEILPRPDREPVELTARDVDGDDPGRLGDDVRNAESVAQ